MLQIFVSFQDTMANVTIGKYSFKDDTFNAVSEKAKDFIRCLLVKDGEWVSVTKYFTHFQDDGNSLRHLVQTLDKERV